MKRILIADDRSENRYLLRSLLEPEGFICEEAKDGSEALRIARAEQPDLLISDLLMPVMDGFTLCRVWRDDPRLAKIPLLFVSSTFNATGDEKMAINLGADAFLNHPVEPEKLVAQVRELLERKRDRPSEGQHHVPDEERRLVEEHLRILARKLEDKVSELERANQELREAESGRDQVKSELEQFFTLSPDLIFILNRDFQFQRVNPAWMASLGQTEAEIRGACLFDFIARDDREGARQEFQDLLESAAPRRFQVRLLRNSGEEFWVEFHLAATESQGIYGIGHDVTEEKKQLEQLHLRDTALKAAALGVVISERNGTIVWVNPAFEKICGYSREELLGNTVEMIRSGKHSPEFYEQIWRKVESGQVWKGEAISRRKDGSLYDEETMITPMRDAQGEVAYYIAFKEDITERKQQERQMERAQRMESIGHLAGGLAHDLNNVLAPIALAIETLRRGEVSEAKRSMLEIMERSCARGSDIIRQVLTFARGIEGDRIPVQLRHLVDELISMVRETFPAEIDIVSDCPRDLWLVEADLTQMHQVLLNLAVNSRDAMPEGGELRIQARNVRLETPRQNLGLEVPAGRYVEIQVLDTGTGIEEEALDYIFEPFFTTKAEGKGTGLGLPTVVGIVRSHRGLLEVNTRRGEGTTMSVFLPAVEHSEGDEDPGESSQEPPRGHGEIILVVDDEESVLKITRAILEEAGYRVLTAGDGAEGVAIFVEQEQKIDLVLTDVIMPVMNGAAMAASLKRLNPGLKIIGSSGYSEDSGIERVQELRALGVETILNKPYRSEVLLQAIQETLLSG